MPHLPSSNENLRRRRAFTINLTQLSHATYPGCHVCYQFLVSRFWHTFLASSCSSLQQWLKWCPRNCFLRLASTYVGVINRPPIIYPTTSRCFGISFWSCLFSEGCLPLLLYIYCSQCFELYSIRQLVDRSHTPIVSYPTYVEATGNLVRRQQSYYTIHFHSTVSANLSLSYVTLSPSHQILIVLPISAIPPQYLPISIWSCLRCTSHVTQKWTLRPM